MGAHAAAGADLDPPRHRGRRSPVSGLPLTIGALIGTSGLLAWSLVDVSTGGSPGGEPAVGLPSLNTTRLAGPTSLGMDADASTTPASNGTMPSASATAGNPVGAASATAPTTPTHATSSRLPAPASATATRPYGMVAETLQPDTLSIVDFHFVGQAPSDKATVDVHIVAANPNPVTLVLTYAGGNTAGQPGDNAPLEHTFTLSGHLTYDVTDTVDTLQFCYTHYFGVSAVLDEYPSAPAYGYLVAPRCT